MNYNLLGFLIFALVTCITPGPNNILLFSSGSRRGFRKSIPLMAGIGTGFFVLLYLAGYGIAVIVASNPTAALVLKIISSAWLLYLAWMIRSIGTVSKKDHGLKAGFVQGFLLQFVNPKAWIMAVGGASAFLPRFDSIHLNVFLYAVIYCAVGVPSMMTWVTAGNVLTRLLKTEKSRRITGWVLAGLMVASVATVWM